MHQRVYLHNSNIVYTMILALEDRLKPFLTSTVGFFLSPDSFPVEILYNVFTLEIYNETVIVCSLNGALMYS